MSRHLSAALAGLLLLAACAESNATADTSEDPWTTKSADREFVRRAEDALTGAPEPEDGWRVGVILAERGDDKWDWAASVLTDDGVRVIEAARTCDGKGNSDADVLPLMIDPGDLVTWSKQGGDDRVCTDELDIIRKAAA